MDGVKEFQIPIFLIGLIDLSLSSLYFPLVLLLPLAQRLGIS